MILLIKEKRVLLTNKGKDITEKVLKKHETLKKELFSNFTNEEKDNISYLLDKFLNNLLEYK